MVTGVDVLPDVAERGGWLGGVTDCAAAGWSLHYMLNTEPQTQAGRVAEALRHDDPLRAGSA